MNSIAELHDGSFSNYISFQFAYLMSRSLSSFNSIGRPASWDQSALAPSTAAARMGRARVAARERGIRLCRAHWQTSISPSRLQTPDLPKLSPRPIRHTATRCAAVPGSWTPFKRRFARHCLIVNWAYHPRVSVVQHSADDLCLSNSHWRSLSIISWRVSACVVDRARCSTIKCRA